MRIQTILAVLLCFFTFVMLPVSAQQNNSNANFYDRDERENVNVYKTAGSAVVTIKSLSASGAGCIIDSSGIIITNKHVIGSSRVVSVGLSDGTTYTANLINVDNDDLALLKINANRSFPYIHLGDSSKIEVGQRVLAIGNPFGLERTLTTGIVSRIDYSLNRIQTDAAINPGNSGGPLLNTRGELIGINQAIYNPSGHSSAGIGFAIPSNTVRRLLALSKNATIVNDTTGTSQKSFKQIPSIVYSNKVFLGLAGQATIGGKVLVSGIASGSPADKAGIKFRDIILAVDSIKVKNFDDIGFALKDKNPGETVNILYMRNGIVNSSKVILVPRT
jgi:S1-C subfamily serine protease